MRSAGGGRERGESRQSDDRTKRSGESKGAVKMVASKNEGSSTHTREATAEVILRGRPTSVRSAGGGRGVSGERPTDVSAKRWGREGEGREPTERRPNEAKRREQRSGENGSQQERR